MAFTADARAFSNIALIKYWGKQACVGNEPAVSSLSITLDGLFTQTKVTFDEAFSQDDLLLNGQRSEKHLSRVLKALEVMRGVAGIKTKCHIETQNNFPTGAGLASSASGFAALVVAINQALGLNLSRQELSQLARSFSGSAARSLFGGFSKMMYHEALSGKEPFGTMYAQTVADKEHWPLSVCVGVISEREKEIGSTEGMEHTRLTSPYYEAWLSGNDQDVAEAEKAVLDKDFEKLALLSEASCLRMHAVAMAANPGILYWEGATIEAIHAIRSMRKQGVPVFFTIDAGPQIKAICLPDAKKQVQEMLENIQGVKSVISCGLGEGAYCE